MTWLRSLAQLGERLVHSEIVEVQILGERLKMRRKTKVSTRWARLIRRRNKMKRTPKQKLPKAR